MKEGNISGISMDGINKLIVDLYDYAEKCNKLSNEIADLIAATKEFYKTDDGNQYRKKFDRFNLGTEKLNKNILSIVSDLNKVKMSYKKQDVGAADILSMSVKQN